MTYPGFMNCIRCGRRIDHPDNTNADYVIGEDTKVDELREVFVVLSHTEDTLAKDKRGEPVDDSEYEIDLVYNPNLLPSKTQYAVKIRTESKLVNIQKTGIICPDCYKDTDTVIWGVHKEENSGLQ